MERTGCCSQGPFSLSPRAKLKKGKRRRKKVHKHLTPNHLFKPYKLDHWLHRCVRYRLLSIINLGLSVFMQTGVPKVRLLGFVYHRTPSTPTATNGPASLLWLHQSNVSADKVHLLQRKYWYTFIWSPLQARKNNPGALITQTQNIK